VLTTLEPVASALEIFLSRPMRYKSTLLTYLLTYGVGLGHRLNAKILAYGSVVRMQN